MDVVILTLLMISIFGFFYRKEIKDKIMPRKHRNYTIDDHYNAEKREREKEIDLLLNKIGKNGLADLSAKDKARLDELSKKQ